MRVLCGFERREANPLLFFRRATAQMLPFLVLGVVLAGCGGSGTPAPPESVAPEPTPASSAAPAQGSPETPLLSAKGTARQNDLELTVESAVAVWNSADQTLRIELHPFALSDEERARVIATGGIQPVRAEKSTPKPGAANAFQPYAEIVLRFNEKPAALDRESLRDVRIGFTGFQREGAVTANQVYVKPPANFVRVLAVSGTSKRDRIRLTFATPAGQDARGAINAEVDTAIITAI